MKVIYTIIALLGFSGFLIVSSIYAIFLIASLPIDMVDTIRIFTSYFVEPAYDVYFYLPISFILVSIIFWYLIKVWLMMIEDMWLSYRKVMTAKKNTKVIIYEEENQRPVVYMPS